MTNYVSKIQTQEDQNKLEIQIESDLDASILAILKCIPHFKRYTINHVSPYISTGIKGTRKFDSVNGFTFFTIYFDPEVNLSPLFVSTICKHEDSFSKLKGRVLVKEKALELLKSAGISKFTAAATVSGFDGKSFLKIANQIIATEVNKKPEKQYEDESLTAETYEKLISDMFTGQDVKFGYLHLRLATPGFYRHNREARQTLVNLSVSPVPYTSDVSRGGITIVTVELPNGESHISYARCHYDDTYNRKAGRKQALRNLINVEKKSMRSLSSVLDSYYIDPTTLKLLKELNIYA